MDEGKSFKIFLAVLSAILSVFFGVLGTNFADVFFFKDQLVYEITYGEPFISNNERIQITRFSVENEGRKLITDIDITINPEGRKIEQYQISGVTKDIVTIIEDTLPFHARLPYLNPGEKLTIQFLLRAAAGIDNNLLPIVRAKGINAQLRSTKEPKNITFLTTMPAVLSTILFGIVISILIREALDKTLQRETMFVLYNKYGFHDFAGRVLSSSDNNIRYILESEALTNHVIANGANDRKIILAAINCRKKCCESEAYTWPAPGFIDTRLS